MKDTQVRLLFSLGCTKHLQNTLAKSQGQLFLASMTLASALATISKALDNAAGVRRINDDRDEPKKSIYRDVFMKFDCRLLSY